MLVLIRARRTRSLVVVAALLAAVAGCVPTSNAYDPETPTEAQAKARITGRVVAESLASPEGISVELVQGGESVSEATAGADGSFALEEVTPGRYTLEVRETGFLPFLLPLSVFAGETLKLGDVELVAQSGEEASAITGVVTLEGQDEGEHGGILVEAVGRSFTTVTSSSGAFLLPVVAGTYDLRFSRASFETATVDGVEVAAGEERALEPVVLSANPATLTGHVEAELAEGGNAPVADATVTVEGTALTALTNGSGDFTLGGVPPGSHLVRVVKDGYVGTSAMAANVIGGETRPLGTFSLLLSRGGLRGVVTLADTTDASGIIVELTGTERAALTGSSGAFSFDDVLLGTYSLSARRDGYNARDLGTFTVSADAVTDTGSFVLSRKSGLVSIVEGSASRSRDISLLITAPTATGYKASEDPTFQDPARGDVEADPFHAFVPGDPAPFTLADADGLHTIYVVTSDGTTTSAPASAEIVLDREPPSVSSVVIGSGAAYLASSSGIVTLHLEGFDLAPAASPGVAVSGIVRMLVSNDAALTGATPLEYRTTTTHTLLDPASEGEKSVYVQLEDAAGNLSAIASATVVLDNTAPENASLVLGGDSEDPAFTRSPFVSASLSADDANGAGGDNLLVRLSNDSGFTGAVYQPFSAGLLTWLLAPGDGDKTVYAQVRDPAGNESLVASDTITLDTQPPTGAFLLVAGGAATTTASSVALTLAAAGASEMALSQDGFAPGTTWEAYAPSRSYALSAEGTVTVSAKFRDDAGWETAVVTDSIVYDATAPAAGTLTLTGTLGDGSSSTAVSASAIVVADPVPAAGDRNEPLAMALTSSADGNCTAADFPASPLFTPHARSSFVLAGGDGNKTVCVIFRDAAGNFDRATARGATIRLDTTSPSAPIFEDLTSGLTSETQVTATVTPSTDAGGAVTYRCFGGTTFGTSGGACNPASPIVFALREDAENTLSVRACDPARNCSEARVTVVQDGTAPLTPVMNTIASGESSISVSWHASASDDVTGYALYYGTAPGDRGSADAEQGASPVLVGDVTSFQLSGLAQGTTYYVSVAAIDAAGNVGDPSGELAATPSKASVRFVSSFGGRPRQLGIYGTRGYLAEPQGVVQMDLDESDAGDVTTGRASVPNVVPDGRGPLAVVPCVADGVLGDCVVLFGSTLEGLLRETPDRFRTGTSLVYFPRDGTAERPAVGRVLTTLPSQARAVVVDPYDDSRFYAVSAEGVTAYALERPAGTVTDVVVQRGHAAHAETLATVLTAGIVGSTLYVLGAPPGEDASCFVDASACVQLYAVDRDALLAGDAIAGQKLGILTNGTQQLASYGPEHDTLGFAFANGLNVVSVVANANGIGVDFLVSHYHAGANGLPLAPTSTRRVVMDSRSTPRPVLAVADGNRVYMGGPNVDALQQLYSVVVASNGGLSLGPTGPRFVEDPQDLSLLAVRDGRAFAAETPGTAGERQLFMRWTVPTSGNLTTFGEVIIPPTGTVMAYEDGLVFLAQQGQIYAFDVTNARSPVLLGAPASAPPPRYPAYSRIKAQGHLVFAMPSNFPGIDIFRYDGELRGLAYVGTAGTNSYHDFAVIGDRLYASRTYASSPLTPGFDRFVLTNPASPTSLGACDTPVPWHVYAFAVRHDTAFLMRPRGAAFVDPGTFRVIDIDDCAAISSDLALPAKLDDSVQLHVSVAGTRALVSDGTSTWPISIASLTSPSNDSLGELPIAGATAQAAGYLIGLGGLSYPTQQQPGPRLVSPLGGGVDGALAHAPCGQETGYSSLELVDGTLFASCGELGIQIVSLAHVGGTVAHDRIGFVSYQPNVDRLATDGNFVLLGEGSASLYDLDTQLFGTDYPKGILPGPSLNTSLTSGESTHSLLYVTGTLITVSTPSSTPRIELRDLRDIDSNWGGEVAGRSYASTFIADTPVTRGRMLYVPVMPFSGTTGIQPLGLGDHNQLTLYATTATPVDEIALSRDRLYVLTRDEGTRVTTLKVYRLLNDGRLDTSPGAHELEIPSDFTPQDLRVHGSEVLVTAAVGNDSSGALLLFEDPGFGTAPVREGEITVITSTLPLADPVVSGDVLFVAENLGVASFDISGALSGTGDAPVRLGSLATGDGTTSSLVDLVVSGPFIYLIGERYRVFDMR